MRAGRIVMVVVGGLLTTVGLGLLIAGTGAVIGHATGRDPDGFFRTGDLRLTSATHAITSERLDLSSDPGDSDWLIDRGALGAVSLQVRPTQSGPAVFAGIGPSDKVEAYLDGVSHDRLDDFDPAGRNVTYQRQFGNVRPSPPGDQAFWVAQLTAQRGGSLAWEVESGDWTVVVMNADTSRGVDLGARVGIKVGWFLPVAIGMVIGGVLILAGGAVLVVLGARGLRQQPGAPATNGPAPTAPSPIPTPRRTPVLVGSHVLAASGGTTSHSLSGR